MIETTPEKKKLSTGTTVCKTDPFPEITLPATCEFMPRVHKRSLLARLGTGVILFIAVILQISIAQGYPKMGKEMANDIGKLVHANSSEYPLPGGWTIHDCGFKDTDITVTLRSGDNSEAVVRLSYPWNPIQGKVVENTISFRLEILEAESEDAEKAALDFCRRIKRNDRSYFFASKNMVRREFKIQYLFRRYVFTPFIRYRLFYIFCFIFVLFALKSPVVRGYFLPKGMYGCLALLAVFVIGLTVRLYVSPSAPIHCNSHGIEEVRTYLHSSTENIFEEMYGKVFPYTARMILGFVGPDEKNIFTMNKIFGALTILAIFLFAKGITGSDAAGIFSAFFFSLSPAQVWMAGTESQIPMFLFVGLTGLGLLCLSARSRDISVLWLSMIMISYAVFFLKI